MRILDRLVAGTFVKLFLISILATPPLFILGELTEDIDRYVDQGMTSLQVASAYIYKVPQYIVWSFPIAALIAAVFTVHGMTTHREIVAAKAGGISFHRLVAPILILSVLLTAVALVLTEVAPRGNRIASEILTNQPRGVDWRTDFVFQSEGGLTLEARRFSLSDRRLTGIVLHRRPEPDAPALHVEAATATWDTVRGWILQSGTYRKIHAPGVIATHQFQRMWIPRLTERPEELLETPPEEEEMTYKELDRLAGIIERSGGEPHELRVRQEQKFSIPAATLVIVLFGTPLATSSKRGGRAYGIGIALGTTILYIALLRISGGFGSTGAIPPLWGAWLPNAVFLAAGLSLLSRVRT